MNAVRTLKTYARTVLLLSAVLLPAAGAAARADQIDALIGQGQEQIYNLRFDQAAALFDKAIALDRNDPRGYFFRANVHLWSYLFDNRKEQMATFFGMSDKAMSVATARLNAAPDDSRAKLFLGISYGYRAIAHARAENISAAALAAKTCYDRLSDVVKTNPRQYDAYLGLGLFHFIFGSVPRAAQVMAGLTGIKGDAPLGVREIQAAAARGVYFRQDAQFISAMMDIYYNGKSDEGLRVMDNILTRYPRNVVVMYAIGAIRLNRRQPAQAAPYFERVVRENNPDFRSVNALSLYQCSKVYFTLNNFQKTKGYLQQYLKVSQEKSGRTASWYMLGTCYEMEGDRANALKAYSRAVQGSINTSPDDRAGNRKAALVLNTPMNANQKNTLCAVNATYANNAAEEKKYGDLLSAATDLTPAQKAQLFYVRGMILFSRTVPDYNGAIVEFTRAMAVTNHPETWVAPTCCFHIGECYKMLNNKEQARKFYDRAKGYHNYDNEVDLRFRIERDVTKID